MKLDLGDYVGDLTPHAYFGVSTLESARVHIRKIVIILVYFLTPLLFSERELTFTVAMCHRPSVCRLSSVTFVRSTQAIEIFGNVSTPFGTLAIC